MVLATEILRHDKQARLKQRCFDTCAWLSFIDVVQCEKPDILRMLYYVKQ